MRGPLRCATVAAGAAILLFASVPMGAADTWVGGTPTGTPPPVRYDGGKAYDAAGDRLILFSGEIFSMPRPSDVWVLSNATGIGGAQAWTQLAPTGGPPSGRSAHTVAYAPGSNRIVVFGGCSANCGSALSDVWVLSNANGTGGTPAWTQLAPAGAAPRAFHSATYDAPGNRMIVFGGETTAFPGTDTNTVRVLSNADGTGGTPAWTTLAPSGTPPAARQGTAVDYDEASNRLMVFGGGTLPAPCPPCTLSEYNDAWVLTNANGTGGTPQWTQLSPLGTPPAARAHHSVEYDPATNRLIVFGGVTDGPTYPDDFAWYDDVWVLTNANGTGGAPEWIQLTPAGGPPAARLGHSSGYHPGYDAMVVAMGRNDSLSPPLRNDVWVLEDANGVQYDFAGFFSPVNNLPTMNSVKAGAAVPVKFGLGGDQGLEIFAPGYPRSRGISCDTSDPVDGIEETVTAGSSSLSYDAVAAQYVYAWKTAKSWAGTCRQLVVRLDDGTSHEARFMFR